MRARSTESLEERNGALPTTTSSSSSPPSRKRTLRQTSSSTRVVHSGFDRRGSNSWWQTRGIVDYVLLGLLLITSLYFVLFGAPLGFGQSTAASPDDQAHPDSNGQPKRPPHANNFTPRAVDELDSDRLNIYIDQLDQALEQGLTELGPNDREKFTIRVNTWRRNEQLIVSLNHHSQCEGVAQIQVIWCDEENEPPTEVLNHPSGKVVVERHMINSLNERFNILTEDTPTLGILSMDDDVLRPCDAIDAGFFRWVANPDRLVGYDARLHIPHFVDDDDGKNQGAAPVHEKLRSFEYGYKSATEKYNRYSLTLPRYCFVHRDYLDLYMSYMPEPILERIEEKFECEDIALSFFVSALTNGAPPLLADFWASKALIKLYSPAAISKTSGHKTVRDKCIEDFLIMLGLRTDSKIKLVIHELWHKEKPMFEFGAEPDADLFVPKDGLVPRHARLAAKVQEMKSMSDQDVSTKVVGQMVALAGKEAKKVGLLDGTDEWKSRWKSKR